MKTSIVTVEYKFKIRYQHNDHRICILAELTKKPIFEMGGSGFASDGEWYAYACNMLEGGRIADEVKK